MHTVEILEQALAAARSLGYKVRQDWLGGGGGGVCEIAGQKWIFIDLAQNATEQLDEVLEGLQADPDMQSIELPEQLDKLFRLRKAA